MNMYEPPLEPFDDFDLMDEWVPVDELSKYDNAKEFLKEVVNQIYYVGDVDALEDALDELTGVFDLKLPSKHPIIRRRR